MESTLARIQQWYASHCDGDWEHRHGISIGTIDNPGWRLKINLAGTAHEGRNFISIEYGLDDDSGANWHRIWVENDCFEGAGDPSKLNFMLEHFLAWADQAGE